MNPVTVIGLGLSPKDLTAEHLSLIEGADVLVGGKRHLAYFPDVRAEKKAITRNIPEVIEFIRDRMAREKVVVLASGDPLFYGIGSLIITAFGAARVRILPNITAIGAAFSAIGMAWSDARLISLHGRRDEAALLAALAGHDKIGLLTDTVHTPAWLADFMIARGFGDFDMCVLEKLGADDETAAWYPLDEAAGKDFRSPNVVILHRTRPERPEPPLPVYPGMPEAAFVHESGLITKAEVRAVTLSKLRLSAPDLVMWDLGAGSGSVSVEAGLYIRTGRIVAVEQHPRRIAQIRANRDRFGINRMEIVHLVMPEGLDRLPAPDRVFIGGGGKNLGRIIEAAAGRLRPGGVMVANTVLIQNIDAALGAFTTLGFETDITQVQISGGKKMPWGDRLQPQNPVWIITGASPDGRPQETPMPGTPPA